MAILKPVVESQVEISLSRDDGSMRYDRSFTAISELIAHRFGAEVTYDPITIESVFDPIFHKDLLAYCVDAFKTLKSMGRPSRLFYQCVIPTEVNKGRELSTKLPVVS